MKNTATQKEKYFWNMMGSFSNALSSMVLAIIVNRLTGAELGGIFAFAFSNAQLMMTIGAFEVRPLQSTDVDEKYSFTQYFSLRLITCTLMILIDLAYIWFSGYTGVKAYTVFLVCIYKMVEGFTDVFSGMFQQHDRIDLVGKSLTLRIFVCTAGFFLVLYATKNLVWASLALGLISAALIFIYDLRLWKYFDNVKIGVEFRQLLPLVWECLPLFISSFIMMYINNAPKYAINQMYPDEIQNIYNILFMPAFVINLFSLFVFRPMLVNLTKEWNERNLKPFVKTVKYILLLIIILTILAMGAAYLLGIPILQIIYGVDISGYRTELVLIMVTGGISALSTFMYYVITVMRIQKYLLVGYLSAFVIALFLPGILVKKYIIAGAVYSCAASLIVLTMVFLLIIISNVMHVKREIR
ncbi:MAG: lipopolysaccharide biosynthesis protein [Lachnospiraceae bacterium]|nr:lipopolysaccharide biosynthesis protein [Lachnospiraceae bacterium]